jgi:zinc transport system ATP-binding protein
VASHPEFVSLFGRHVANALAVYEHHHDHVHDASGAAVPVGEAEQPVRGRETSASGPR